MRLLFAALFATALSVPAVAADLTALREACKADVLSLCQGVQPGGGRIKQCLKANKDKLSGGCKSAIAAMIQARREAKQQQQTTTPATQGAPPAQ